MSPPNLDRLLVLPSGCGEQNLVRLATNWVVADYLDVTEQLSDFIAVKVKNNIQIGMQNGCDNNYSNIVSYSKWFKN